MNDSIAYFFHNPSEFGVSTMSKSLIRVSYMAYISFVASQPIEFQTFHKKIMCFYLSCEFPNETFDVEDKEFIPEDYYHKLESIAVNRIQPININMNTMETIQYLFPKSQIYGNIIDFNYHGVTGYIHNDMIFMRGILPTQTFKYILSLH